MSKYNYIAIYPIERKQAQLFDIDGNIVGIIDLPLVFSLPIRVDVIRRAVHSALTAKMQVKARDPLAGKRRVGESWGIGYSVARVPRLDNGRAVFAPNVVGGRRQFAPTTLKKIHEEINRKEMRFAIMSALSALASKEFVLRRGYEIPQNIELLPIVVVNSFEEISSTKELRNLLEKMGLWKNIERTQQRTRIRAGKGKRRGRRYITPKSLLFIVSDIKAPIIRAARNLPGIDYLTPDNLNILVLAPGGMPGRLAIISQKALELINQKYLVVRP